MFLRTRWRTTAFRWGKQQPPVGYMVDRGHPLATGLIAAWVCNSGTGQGLTDLSWNGRHMRMLAIGANPLQGWTLGDRGGVLTCPVNTSVMRGIPYPTSDPDPIWVRSTMTILVRFRPYTIAVGNGGYAWFAKSDGPSGLLPSFRFWWEESVGASQMDVKHFSGGLIQYKVNGNAWTPTVNQFYTVGVTKNGLDHVFYRDGVADGTAAAANNATLPQVTLAANIGFGDIAGPVQYGNDDIEYVYVWDRVLQANEIKDATDNPYDFIEPFEWSVTNGTSLLTTSAPCPFL